MQTYSEFSPSPHDAKGIGLEDQQNWLVVPVMRTRDSGPLEESNFNVALEMLGGKSDDIEIHRFKHYGPGWFEIIIVNPDNEEKVRLAKKIEKKLEDHSILDEDDLSKREANEFYSDWIDYGSNEFVDALKREFELTEDEIEKLENSDKPALLDFYMNVSSDPYISESSGIFINTKRTAQKMTVEDLEKLIKLISK